MTGHRNRLANETSPYLLQHAGNPVDWYPWGEEAFNKAKADDKPIFLSIGYSSCHWCHVMERESFENDSIAAIMNQNFVNIKVDREERPDLDDIYMTFVQLTTGGGGWPLSVFLTPDGKPFFGGTYFPPTDAYGRRGFPFILQAVAQAWRQDREKVLESSDSAVMHLRAALTKSGQTGTLTPEVLDSAVQQMLDRFDPIDGGFGGAPKFPPSFSLSLLMRHYYRTKNPQVLKAFTFTLDKMASGGMYDQLGGGFHRYSTDAQWLVPHFEKMLYDNALLTVAYLDAYQITHKPLYKRIAIETLDYILRDMTDADGGFHSAEDADSEGKEGKFYVWTPEEVIDALGTEDGKLFCDYFGVTNSGNHEDGRSILHIRVSPETFTKNYKMTEDNLGAKLTSLKVKLLAARNKRIHPHKDDKVLSDWNGLMLAAFARGYQIAGDRRYLDAALNCAHFIETKMLNGDGLLRVYRHGKAKQHGFVTDYAFVANGLIDLYEASFDWKWLKLADRLTREMIDKFSDSTSDGFFMTLSNQSDLLVRQKDSYDGAIPSGNSVAAMALLRLSTLLGNKEYYDGAQNTFASLAVNVSQTPLAYMNLLNAFDFSYYRPKEIAFVGNRSSGPTERLIQQLYSEYLPNKVVALIDPTDPAKSDIEALIPLLKGRTLVDRKATAYVCKNFVCKLPVNSPEAFVKQLAEE